MTFSAELELIADRSLLEVDELFFNAARLDRSVALSTEDYVQIAAPRIEGNRDPARRDAVMISPESVEPIIIGQSTQTIARSGNLSGMGIWISIASAYLRRQLISPGSVWPDTATFTA
jgi:hypothetical protein